MWGARFPLEDWNKGSLAERVYARYKWMSRWVMGPRVLDIGCSHGALVSFIEDKNIEQYVGVDVNPKALAFAKKTYGRPWALFTRKVEEGSVFNTVVLGEVLEHQEYPLHLLLLAKKYLDENGIIIITVPHGCDEVSDHRQIFTSYSFVELMNRAGLFFKHLSFEGERILAVVCKEEPVDKINIDHKQVEDNLNSKHERMLRSYRLMEHNYKRIPGISFLKEAGRLWTKLF